MERSAYVSYPYENGVVMTRDPKPRLRWTADLHDRFVDAVTKLGGPDSQSLFNLSSSFVYIYLLDYASFFFFFLVYYIHAILV